jgi:hypothetical protein
MYCHVLQESTDCRQYVNATDAAGLTVRICDHQNTEEELVAHRNSGDSGSGRATDSKSGRAAPGGYTADELRLLAKQHVDHVGDEGTSKSNAGAAVSAKQSFTGLLVIVVVFVLLLVVAVGVTRALSKQKIRRTGVKAGGGVGEAGGSANQQQHGAARKRRGKNTHH